MRGISFAHNPEDGKAEEDEGGAEERAFEVVGVAGDENGGGAEDEKSAGRIGYPQTRRGGSGRDASGGKRRRWSP